MSRQRNSSLILTCGLLAQVSFAATPIANPIRYAEQNSKSFAEGDASDNSDRSVRLSAFLDDMGLTSSLVVRGHRYDMTCAPEN